MHSSTGMLTGRFHLFEGRPPRRFCARAEWWCSIAGLTILAMAVAGCSGQKPFQNSSSASMKTTLSHLQFENEQLRTEVAKLKEENRSIEDRLVQEQLHTGDLAARLDNARNLLRDRGIDGETRLGSRSEASDPDDDLSRPRALPAGRSTRKPRKPPTASIPSEQEAKLPRAREGDEGDGGTISFKAPGSAPPRSRSREDSVVKVEDEDDSFVWQPVAQGGDSESSSKR